MQVDGFSCGQLLLLWVQLNLHVGFFPFNTTALIVEILHVCKTESTKAKL